MTGKQLKNSILQWAIQGKLVPQDPNDEPASVLLEKIRQEKERLIKEKKIKRDKNASIIFRGEDNSYYEKFLATGEVKCIDEEIPFEIPQGWEWSKLSNVIELLSGQDFIPEKYNSSNQGIPYITGASNIVNGNLAINRWTETPTVIGKLGDLLIVCKGSGVGKMCICNVDKIHIARQIQIIRNFSNAISLSYVKSVVEANLQTIISNAQGVIPGISREHILNLLIPLPPTNEQYEIDKKLQEILPFIDRYAKSQEALDKLNVELLGNLKKSILQEAVQGRLVPQIAEEGTARELLEQIRQEKQKLVEEGKLKKTALTDSIIYKGDDNRYYEKIDQQCKDITEEIPFDLPDSWTWVRLGCISDIIGGYAFQSSSLKEEQGKRVIRISDISEQGFVNTKIVRYNGAPITDIYRIQKYDIIIAMTGGTVGKSLFVKELPEDELLLNQRVARIRNLWMNVDYLYFVIIAPHIKEFINKQKNSTNDNISMSDISNFLIPLPSIKEQQRIVAQIERLFEQLK